MDITGMGSFFDLGGKIIDKLFPDKDAANKAKLDLLKLQQEGQLKELELEYGLLAKQSDINLKEAESPNLFISGWRPAVGWTRVLGLAYSVLGQPVMVACRVAAPVTDTSILIQLLFALLGVAGLRTFEKAKGVASK